MIRRPALALLPLVIVATLAGCASPIATPEDSEPVTVTVLAAASLTDSFAELEQQFEADNPGVDVVLSVGGSSALAEQIVAGSPADVFAAANGTTMATVVDAGLTEGDPRDFATNTLQIVTPSDNPGAVGSLADFATAELLIALCESAVPCGSASDTVFATAGITPAPDTLEQDVKAVLTKVELGEVDAGLVYRTDVIAAGEVVLGIDFLEADSAINHYPIAALSAAADAGAGADFVAFVLSPTGQTILQEAGFGAP